MKSLGLVVEENNSEESKNKKNPPEIIGSFDSLYSWQLDEPHVNAKTEPFNKAMNEWFSAMEIVFKRLLLSKKKF